MKKYQKFLAAGFVIGMVVVLAAWLLPNTDRAGAKASYVTTLITRGEIEESVTSSGTIEAKGSVDVLTQLTGTIEKVYVDFNDTVKKGQPLAELNTDMLTIALREAEASLHKAKAQFDQDSLSYANNKKLFDRNLISDFDLQASRTVLEISRATQETAQAGWDRAKLNLDTYAKILSPMNGIVLDRNIEKGQTVVANSGSVTQLFTLAENLNTMEIYAEVDELDIGKITKGQSVRFSVEAYPENKFTGTVTQIRHVPVTEDNVVNYTVIVDADNAVGVLLPGMTANLEFLVTQKTEILLIPNSALRFSPSADIAAAAKRKALEERLADRTPEERKQILERYDAALKSSDTPAAGTSSVLGGVPRVPGMGGPGGPERQTSSNGSSGAAANEAAGNKANPGKPIWLLKEDGSLSLRNVKTGVTDGTNTEILDADSLEGLAVIVKVK